MNVPAIVLSSHTMGLGVIRSLGQMGVPVIAVSYHPHDMGFVSKYVSERIFSPHPEKREDSFLDLLRDCGNRFGRCLLIPADDATLSVVSRHKSGLQQHHIVACTEWDITETFIDKMKTYNLAKSAGIPVPRTILPSSTDDLETFHGSIEYPVIVKPCVSHRYYEMFGRKMSRVSHFDELMSSYREARKAGIPVMLQEFIPGDDTNGVNYNSYFWNGQPLLEFTAEKVRLSPPHFGVPTVVKSRIINAVIGSGRTLLQAMGFYGYSCMEFKMDIRDGIYKLMEVNGRHNRSTLLALRCGLNFPWVQYRHLVHDELPVPKSFLPDVYWIDEFKDIAQYVQPASGSRESLFSFLRPYLRPHVYAIYETRDLKPFFKRIGDMTKLLMKKENARLQSALPSGNEVKPT
jgi:predicted ATP-grasp superfamily ATP-dependent carboligase